MCVIVAGLLEEKGVVHKPGPAGTTTGPDAGAGEKKHHLPLPHHGAATGTADEHHATTTGTEAGGGKEKVGLKDKIKAKLHMGSTSA